MSRHHISDGSSTTVQPVNDSSDSTGLQRQPMKEKQFSGCFGFLFCCIEGCQGCPRASFKPINFFSVFQPVSLRRLYGKVAEGKDLRYSY